jgi:hypothetical protein
MVDSQTSMKCSYIESRQYGTHLQSDWLIDVNKSLASICNLIGSKMSYTPFLGGFASLSRQVLHFN